MCAEKYRGFLEAGGSLSLRTTHVETLVGQMIESCEKTSEMGRCYGLLHLVGPNSSSFDRNVENSTFTILSIE